MKRYRLLPVLILLLCASWGCGEDESEDPNAIVCGSGQPFKQIGVIAEPDGQESLSGEVAAEAGMLEGQLTTREIVFRLGDVEFTPAGSDTPETRPLVLSFNTNVGDPMGRDLLTNISLRIDSLGDQGRTFQLVSPGDDETYFETYCDVANGQLCARYGLDDTSDGEVSGVDKVIHLAQGGTVTFTTVTSTSLEAEWNIDFGPNVSRAFDESGGVLEGCFSAIIGQGTSEGNALTSP